MNSIEQRLHQLGLSLPAEPPRPAGNYLAAIENDGILFIAAQLPIENGVPRYTGRVGAELTEDEGRAAAQLAALNVLAQIRDALGGFERLKSLLRVEGHVASAPGWTNAPRILDGASDLFIVALAERGHHVRSAFVPERLPLNLSVELVVTAAVHR
jgi:enamine deaminase RidA (YjgF/YER057c/UK114 family)